MWPIAAHSKGIGLRSEHLAALCQSPKRDEIDFLELAPENWMGIGGEKREMLECIAEKYPLVAHGLNLSIGDAQPLNRDFVREVAGFLKRYQIGIYSEHLSFSRDRQGYLYDLLPLPRHQENISYIADRINCVQDIIQRPLALENISYYYCYENDMPEQEFFNALVEKTECQLLLDINNLYVNARNHHYDPMVFLKSINADAIRYFHIAGHFVQEDGFTLDTHGTSVSQQVITLARTCFDLYGPRPLLLERDHHLPTLSVLCDELATVHEKLVMQEEE
ncbi:DUF692 domain-containing protein [Serratia nematodiphila]|uniref:DUF692 domain-containing protein n=1 Tax=Serratia nematodiphila TaxID=458197 RepID=UPI0011DA6ECF|nr:DUF692 domain-containing protein [Serratia nematodiphila]TXE66639.1 DUF692 domain-containing protein [Serratia nematodiphila]